MFAKRPFEIRNTSKRLRAKVESWPWGGNEGEREGMVSMSLGKKEKVDGGREGDGKGRGSTGPGEGEGEGDGEHSFYVWSVNMIVGNF